MKKFDEQVFIAVCQNSLTMAEAARELNMHFNTFKRHAVRLGCYSTNPSGKGVPKRRPQVIATQDILAGKFPDYETYKLKKRLIREGYLEDKCQLCGWAEKRDPSDAFTPCELHHIDGNSRNHQLSNLLMCCPNCHSLQKNYRSKNRAGSQG